jgi:hypothetical protein
MFAVKPAKLGTFCVPTPKCSLHETPSRLLIGPFAPVCYKSRRTFGDFVPFINFPAREINCKLVYYGPGLGGKTANLQWVYENTGANQRGKMISLATETDRTFLFDFLLLDL